MLQQIHERVKIKRTYLVILFKYDYVHVIC